MLIPTDPQVIENLDSISARVSRRRVVHLSKTEQNQRHTLMSTVWLKVGFVFIRYPFF